MTAAKAPLVEVFSSVQGEGRHAGVPMTFVRVAVCPIRCTYCDTPNSYTAHPTFPVRSGDRETTHRNPVTAEAAARLAAQSAAANPYGATRFVSLTGGEPLVYPEFVRAFGDALHQVHLLAFLESAAVDAGAFAACAASVDHASFDYKLPETLAEGDGEALAGQCVRCVELAVAREIPVDVKLVLTPGVAEASVATALSRLRPFRDRVTLVLQPVTPCGAEDDPCPPGQVAGFAAAAAAAGFAPRVLPQIHKLLGVE